MNVAAIPVAEVIWTWAGKCNAPLLVLTLSGLWTLTSPGLKT